MQESAKAELAEVSEALLATRVERDAAAYKLQQARTQGGGAGANAAGALADARGGNNKENAGPAAAFTPRGSVVEGAGVGEVGPIRGYLDRIARLEKEIRRLKEVETA